jgi:transketolase
VPTLDDVPEDAIERGAYVLRDTDGDPDLILIGTGSEVGLCVQTAELLAGEGIAARVVSMPCWESFAAQDQGYRDSVLPPAVRARVSVEAASTFGWERWVGSDGDMVGRDDFGASAPAKVLYEEFGFTPGAIAARAKVVVERVGRS